MEWASATISQSFVYLRFSKPSSSDISPHSFHPRITCTSHLRPSVHHRAITSEPPKTTGKRLVESRKSSMFRASLCITKGEFATEGLRGGKKKQFSRQRRVAAPIDAILDSRPRRPHEYLIDISFAYTSVRFIFA